jgi:hypothetical protein
MTFDMNTTIIVAAAFAALAVVVLLRGRSALRCKTLLGAWSWAVASLVALAGVELANPSLWSAPLRFAAAALVLCPTIAVLGAKRPQHLAWHWIVLSLWVVLCIPAANAALFHAGGAVELHVAQGTFLWLLILLGLANYLPTRYAAAAMLIAAGQLFLFSPHLPLVRAELTPHATTIGITLVAVGLALSPLALRKPVATSSLDAVWRDFRDHFGAFWAVRVMVRLNTAAEMNRWPIRLHWSGFAPRSAVDPQLEKVVRRCLNSMLRRFV